MTKDMQDGILCFPLETTDITGIVNLIMTLKEMKSFLRVKAWF